MRSSLQLLGAFSLVVLCNSYATAQGIEIEGEASYERTNTEGLDLKRTRVRGQFVQRIKTNSMRLPLFIGLEIKAFEQERIEESLTLDDPFETKNAIGNLLIGFGLSEKGVFKWRQLFGVSLQYSEAFDESFVLSGASLQTNLELNVYSTNSYNLEYYLDLKAAGRLGTDSSHASGVARTGLQINLSKAFKIDVIFGGGARASFFVENLGLNSKLEKFNIQVDVGLVAAEIFLQVWKIQVSGYHSPCFAGRYTGQSHLGVINNGGAEHSGATGNLKFDF